MSVVTSLPDVSELKLGFDAWRVWFLDAARRVVRWIPKDGVAIFFQSDIRHRGAWVDKGYLIARAAEDEQVLMLWHKVVCRLEPGRVDPKRAAYSHMICLARPGSAVRGGGDGPDVLPSGGFKPKACSMGEAACRLACAYVRDRTPTSCVVDPFCGYGTVLAVANALGLDAVGVDWNVKRCRAARALELQPQGA